MLAVNNRKQNKEHHWWGKNRGSVAGEGQVDQVKENDSREEWQLYHWQEIAS